MPSGSELSNRVKQLTGLSEIDLETAAGPERVWRHLSASISVCGSLDPGKPIPVVIHYARFERPILERMRQLYSPDAPFAFEIICTHEIARRLFPHLPRRGLRALAGYFDHAVSEQRRCAAHVLATAHIWTRLVERLKASTEVKRLSDLRRYFENPPAKPATTRRYPMTADNRCRLPAAPGIYRMQRANGGLLYVGKAGSLRQRVNSYFQPSRAHPEHILEMLTQARRIDVTTTPSALEAALLEAETIKAENPPYNQALRDKGQQTVFCSPDYQHSAPKPEFDRSIGPLPSQWPVDTAKTLIRLLSDSKSVATPPKELLPIFMTSGSDQLSKDCLTAGFAHFNAAHQLSPDTAEIARRLPQIGAAVWRQRSAANPGEDEAVPPETDIVAPWTPERVAERIEGFFSHTAHLIRRARWLNRLCEASFGWYGIDGADSQARFLTVSAGKITSVGPLPDFDTLPVPTETSYRHRQGCFDIATYDRLRVLTTEIRRLVATGRRLQIRFGPTARLDGVVLKKLLFWI